MYVGPGDWNLWAIDSNGGLHVRTGISIELPGGSAWDSVPDVAVSSLCISEDAVWARLTNGELVRRCGVTPRNPLGDYWRRVPGSPAQIMVTPGNELWVIDDEGELSMLETCVFTSKRGAMLNMESVEDAGWEVL